MTRQNCWEVKKCGREPGGGRAEELGTCPAALPAKEYDGVNQGLHGGRFCWAVAGTLCGGKRHGCYAVKLLTCLGCDFLKQVNREEGASCILSPNKLDWIAEQQAAAGETRRTDSWPSDSTPLKEGEKSTSNIV